ncbi:PHP domain-containing protein [Klebsiella oxytoca]|uniref:PHP domain-containing protein n=1 Tax=Klebsiella oxytoca TaxID=571 RepID=UPI0021AFC2DE|nr:PHP domain-containing protein [Klebsiella oxytoca]
MKLIDLHMHSAYSNDADFPVSDLLTMAKAANLAALAITDHNSARSVEESIRYGRANSVSVMTGIEIDCAFAGNNYHLLATVFVETAGILMPSNTTSIVWKLPRRR